MTPAAHKFLSRADPVMARLVKTHGRCVIEPREKCSPFESLVRAIGHQQLNGRAAETILSRFQALFPGGQFPTPEMVLAKTDEQLRSVGLSRSKTAAIKDLADKTVHGIVPTRRTIERWSNEEIIEHLVQVRGVGVWTVEMLLIFTLAREDVLPVNDFGVRNGFMIAYGRDEMPKPRELAEFGKRWAPHRSTAAWYLWRAADASKAAK